MFICIGFAGKLLEVRPLTQASSREVFVIAAAAVKCACFRQEKKKSALLYDLSSAHQYASVCSDIVPVARLCDPTPICQGWAEEK